MDKIEKAINLVAMELINDVGKYFEMIKEYECLDRIDIREQTIMRMLPTVFKNRLFKKLGAE